MLEFVDPVALAGRGPAADDLEGQQEVSHHDERRHPVEAQ
jgi:hypothetical protein